MVKNISTERLWFIMNISTNLKAIDSLKSAVLCEIAKLYNELSDHDADKDEQVIEQGIASVIAMSYMLSRRLGFEYTGIDNAMCNILSLNSDQNFEDEISLDMKLLNNHISKTHKSV